MGEWCDTWLEGYRGNRATTVRQAEVHIARIRAEFGDRRLPDVRPSYVRTWCASLSAEGLSDSYVHALHARHSQLYADAVPDHVRAAVLLGAFAALRLAEACGLRVNDVDLMRGAVSPAVRYPAEPLKSDTSRASIPVGRSMALELAGHVQRHPSRDGSVLIDQLGRQLAPWTLERAVQPARSGHAEELSRAHAKECTGCLVPDLPPEFRLDDLRHYFASLLIASGADVKVVRARLRHASAKTRTTTSSPYTPSDLEL